MHFQDLDRCMHKFTWNTWPHEQARFPLAWSLHEGWEPCRLWRREPPRRHPWYVFEHNLCGQVDNYKVIPGQMWALDAGGRHRWSLWQQTGHRSQSCCWSCYCQTQILYLQPVEQKLLVSLNQRFLLCLETICSADTLMLDTLLPIWWTKPAASVPGVYGSSGNLLYWPENTQRGEEWLVNPKVDPPSLIYVSTGLMPATTTLTITCSSPTSGTGTLRSTWNTQKGFPQSWHGSEKLKSSTAPGGLQAPQISEP